MNIYEENLSKYGSFNRQEWEADKRQLSEEFDKFKQNINLSNTPENINFKNNLIDSLYPFVNKRGVRSKLFSGNQHEVKLVQLDNIPGYAKLIYRDIEKSVGAIEQIYINSYATIIEDVSKYSKKLYKKAKKL